ncbi:HD domain-containing protein [Candidatus Peregrinibacteria bacterium]|nr:HD domain-containing protein [Candidatus Peregrinibacteria bacterium]MBT4148513.1 HD domain-containing protein [Candidatus Peregrinibacteria bacterium]MBT4366706.1 HD domain-containing protein [Candidatus Peregrinibacteria bacterium]MBT4455525.1 HD domain-containing protein [Candidatus Peregrinibacteria bacterium]
MFEEGDHDGLDGDDAIESGEPVDGESDVSRVLSEDGLIRGGDFPSTDYVVSFVSGLPEEFVTALAYSEKTREIFEQVEEVINWLIQDLQGGRLQKRFGDKDSVREGLSMIDDVFINVCRVVFYEIKKKREELGFDHELVKDDYVQTIYNLHDTLYLLRDEVRDNGDSYFYSHIIGVLLILIREGGFTGAVTRTSAIGHDTSEDKGLPMAELLNISEYTHRLTGIPEDELKVFDRRVTNIVTGLTKIKRADKRADKPMTKYERREATSRLFWQTFLKETKIAPVKLADRIHNMRTLGFKKGKAGDDAQERISRETEEVYSPVAKIARLRDMYRSLVFATFENRNPQFVVDFAYLQFERRALLDDCADDIESSLVALPDVDGVMFRDISISEYVDSLDKSYSDVQIENLDINCLDSMQECVVFVKEGDDDILNLVSSYIVGIFGMEPAKSLNVGKGKNLVGFSRQFGKQLSFRIITKVDYNREIRGVYLDEEDALDPFKEQIQSLLDRRSAGLIDDIIKSAKAELLGKPMRLTTPMGDKYELLAGSSYLDFLAAVNPYDLGKAAFAEWSRSLDSKGARKCSLWDEIERSPDPKDVPMVNVRTLTSEEIASPEKMHISPLWLLYCVTPKAIGMVKSILKSPYSYYRQRVDGDGNGHSSTVLSESLEDGYEQLYIIENGKKCVDELSGLFGVRSPKIIKVLKNGDAKKSDDCLLHELGTGSVNPLRKLVKHIKPRERWHISLSLLNQPGIMEHFSREFGKCGFSLGGIKSRRIGDLDESKMFVSKPAGSADSMIDTYGFLKALIRLRLAYPDLKVTDSVL